MRDIGVLRAKNSYFLQTLALWCCYFDYMSYFLVERFAEYFLGSNNLRGLELLSQSYINMEFMWQKNTQQLHIINCNSRIIAEKRHSMLVFY